MATAISTSISSNCPDQYDRLKEIQQFDDSKLGVKGLVDSGVTSIPRFFIHPAETLSDLKKTISQSEPETVIPTIDLSGAAEANKRSNIVEQISSASREFGFFQVVNHGIPLELMDRLISNIKGLLEQPPKVKTQWYRRDVATTGVGMFSNYDLFYSKAASWRDTLEVRLGPVFPKHEDIPEMCRNEVVEWNMHTKRLAELLMEFLCEGLRLDPGRLKEMTCLESRTMAAHYYPYCPQPDLTFGIISHTDPGVLTLVLQDHIGGLQVKHSCEWVDVKHVPRALIVNVGDILQIMSNDQYKSVEHRVLANSCREARLSVSIFFNPSHKGSLYGPLPELISLEKPALYRQITIEEYARTFITSDLDQKTLTSYFKL